MRTDIVTTPSTHIIRERMADRRARHRHAENRGLIGGAELEAR